MLFSPAAGSAARNLERATANQAVARVCNEAPEAPEMQTTLQTQPEC